MQTCKVSTQSTHFQEIPVFALILRLPWVCRGQHRLSTQKTEAHRQFAYVQNAICITFWLSQCACASFDNYLVLLWNLHWLHIDAQPLLAKRNRLLSFLLGVYFYLPFKTAYASVLYMHVRAPNLKILSVVRLSYYLYRAFLDSSIFPSIAIS